MAKVSVIVPIYGVEKYLRECLDSIVNQTLSDLEIILIDDGSKDNCPQIIDEYAQKDNRIIAIHKENDGYGSAMNVGLENVTGEYIGIVEPDDYIDSKMYEDLYKIAKEYDSDVVKSCFYDNLQAKEEQRILKTKWDDDKIPQNRSFKITECGLFLQYHPSIWSCIYKRKFLKKHNIRFIEAPGSGWTDNPFQVQTMCRAERINYTPNAYYYWRRLNKDESDDLKDYTVPFKRTEEIHKWLEENNINDDEILSNLFSRELSYASIVLGKKDLVDVNNAIYLANKMTKNMDKDLIFSSENIKKRNKKAFKLIWENPLKYRKQILFQKFKKNLISIRWNKCEKRVILFGRTVLSGKNNFLAVPQPYNTINICFSSDENYVQHLCACIKSIIYNKNNSDKFNFIILDGGITDRSKKYITSLIDQNSGIEFVKADNDLFKNCPLTVEAFHIKSLSTYYRFILADVCKFDKILYLDCDIIVNSSLSTLFNTNIENYYFAGVEDVYCKENCERLNLSQYCNAGVMLINLNLWRKNAIKEKLFNWVLNNKEKIKWVDQDVINSVLQDKILYLNDKFNTQVSVLEFGKTKDNNKKACQSSIIHFVGCEKPWQKKNFVLYKYYWKYILKLPGQYSWKWAYVKYQIKHFRKFIVQLKIGKTEQYLRIFNFTIFEYKRSL